MKLIKQFIFNKYRRLTVTIKCLMTENYSLQLVAEEDDLLEMITSDPQPVLDQDQRQLREDPLGGGGGGLDAEVLPGEPGEDGELVFTQLPPEQRVPL